MLLKKNMSSNNYTFYVLGTWLEALNGLKRNSKAVTRLINNEGEFWKCQHHRKNKKGDFFFFFNTTCLKLLQSNKQFQGIFWTLSVQWKKKSYKLLIYIYEAKQNEQTTTNEKLLGCRLETNKQKKNCMFFRKSKRRPQLTAWFTKPKTHQNIKT